MSSHRPCAPVYVGTDFLGSFCLEFVQIPLKTVATGYSYCGKNVAIPVVSKTLLILKLISFSSPLSVAKERDWRKITDIFAGSLIYCSSPPSICFFAI
jgi:hypothetical protein